MPLLSRRSLMVALVAGAAAACGPKGGAAQSPQNGQNAQAEAPDPAVAAAAAYLAKNGKEAGVMTTASGLQYKIVKSGPAAGQKPGPHDEVKVNYEGTLTDGTVFDSSYKRGEPAVFGVDQVVPGWTEVLQLMRPGDEWTVFLPPNLGYGAEASGPIPANSVLVFRMELLDVLKAPPANA